jgi:hypothetical protein
VGFAEDVAEMVLSVLCAEEVLMDGQNGCSGSEEVTMND